MTEFFKHKLDLTDHNLNKIGSNVQTSLRHNQIGSGLDVHLSGPNNNKIMKAHSNCVGCRIHLTPEEVDHNIQHGTGLGKFLNHTFGHNTARKIKNSGKLVARTLLNTAVPMLASTLGPLSGVAGAVVGNIASQNKALQNGSGIKYGKDGVIIKRKKGKKETKKLKDARVRRIKAPHPTIEDYHSDSDIDESIVKAGGSVKGDGFFRTMHKLGVSKKQIKRVGKRMGKTLGHVAATAATIAAAEHIGDNKLGQQMLEHAHNATHNAIESKMDNVKEIARHATHDALPDAHNLIHKSVLHHTGNKDLADHLANSSTDMILDGLQRHGEGLRMKKYATYKPIPKTGGLIDSNFPFGLSSRLPANSPAMNPFQTYGSIHSGIQPTSNVELKRGGSFN